MGDPDVGGVVVVVGIGVGIEDGIEDGFDVLGGGVGSG